MKLHLVLLTTLSLLGFPATSWATLLITQYDVDALLESGPVSESYSESLESFDSYILWSVYYDHLNLDLNEFRWGRSTAIAYTGGSHSAFTVKTRGTSWPYIATYASMNITMQFNILHSDTPYSIYSGSGLMPGNSTWSIFDKTLSEEIGSCSPTSCAGNATKGLFEKGHQYRFKGTVTAWGMDIDQTLDLSVFPNQMTVSEPATLPLYFVGIAVILIRLRSSYPYFKSGD